ncbi:putative ribonuclease H-like domain-containing protein [Tanacetum coccineum]
MEVVTVGWQRWRVEESGVGDRVDPEVGSVFGLRRKSPPEKFSGGGATVAGGGRFAGEERCDNGGEFRNKEMDDFCSRKGIKREFSNARTPQKNGVAERRNRTLIEAAGTMLADTKLPITFWAEAVNTACYVQNRVLVTKPLNKTPYDLFNGRAPAIGFLRPDLVKVIDKAGGPNWLFDIESLTKSMNYIPVVGAGTSSSNISGTKEDVKQAEKGSPLRFIALPNWFHEAQMITTNDAAKKRGGILIDSPQKEQEEVHTDKDVSEQVEHEVNEEVPESSGITFPTASSKESSKLPSIPTVETAVPTVSTHVPTDSENIFTIDPSEPPSTPTVESTVPTVSTPVPTVIKSRGGLRYSQPPSISNAVSSENRVEDFFGDSTHATRLNEVEADLSNMETTIQVLVDCPKGVRPIGTKWVLKNKKDEKGIVIRNKARLVAEDITGKSASWFFKILISTQMPIRCQGYVWTSPSTKAWKHKGEFLLVQVYVDDIIFGSSNPKLCREFEALMHDKFKMSAMGELSFFLGLQVLQKKDGIFLSQDKYVGDILKKFGFSDLRSANTPMDRENPWGKDGTGKDVDLHLYRSMIGILMTPLHQVQYYVLLYISTYARTSVTPKECPSQAVKENLLDIIVVQDKIRSQPLRNVSLLGRIKSSWQCKKQTIVATSTTKAEYVAAASGCGQVLLNKISFKTMRMDVVGGASGKISMGLNRGDMVNMCTIVLHGSE